MGCWGVGGSRRGVGELWNNVYRRLKQLPGHHHGSELPRRTQRSSQKVNQKGVNSNMV